MLAAVMAVMGTIRHRSLRLLAVEVRDRPQLRRQHLALQTLVVVAVVASMALLDHLRLQQAALVW
jgi:hypothetical protein